MKIFMKKWYSKYIVTFFSVILAYIIFFYMIRKIQYMVYAKEIIFLGTIIIYFILIKIFNKKFDPVYFILMLGIVFRIIYVIYTNYDTRQYDVMNYNCGPAHLDYAYILSEGHLPNTNEWQTYHPPLNAIIQGFWIRISSLLDNKTFTLEGLQIFSLIYSIFMLFFVYDISNILNLKKESKIFVFLIACFHPSLIYLSGGLNNDALIFMLGMAMIYFLFKWLKNDCLKNFIILSIVVALAMMTKNTALLYLGLVLIILLYKIIKNHNYKKGLIQIILFLIITIPIGAFYQIRNYILFKQSFFYVPSFDWFFMYTGKYSIFQRLSIFPIQSLFLHVSSHLSEEYQIIPYLFRNSISGIWGIPENFITKILYITNIILIIITFIAFVISIFKIPKNNIFTNIILLFQIFLIISYFLFALNFPYASSMEYRYISITCIFGMLIFVLLLESKKINIKINRLISIIMYSILSIFSFTSIITFMSIL